MFYKLALENWSVLKNEAGELFKKHWSEVAYYKDILLNVDHETYLGVEQTGAMKVFTVRTGENALVGYAVYFLKHNLHYSESFQANQDIIFIDPAHRGFGNHFIKWCDKELKKSGVQVVHHHVKATPGLNFGKLLERQGYELVDLIYAKRLDRE